MVGNLKKEDFQQILFEAEIEKTSAKVSTPAMKSFDDREYALRDKIFKRKEKYREEHEMNTAEAYEALWGKCQISVDALKKVISGTLAVSRNFLYKFTVGLHMTVEEANEYFALQEGPLRESCMADFICLHALQDQDDIRDFISDFEKYTGHKIGLKNSHGK